MHVCINSIIPKFELHYFSFKIITLRLKHIYSGTSVVISLLCVFSFPLIWASHGTRDYARRQGTAITARAKKGNADTPVLSCLRKCVILQVCLTLTAASTNFYYSENAVSVITTSSEHPKVGLVYYWVIVLLCESREVCELNSGGTSQYLIPYFVGDRLEGKVLSWYSECSIVAEQEYLIGPWLCVKIK